MQDNLAGEELAGRRLRCRLAYDGTAYAGWQYQPAAPTVQGTLEQALCEVTGHPVRASGAGRTDAGVHATGQVVHWDNPSTLEPDILQRALNARLPEAIRVRQLEPAEGDFHARFSACARRYRYRLVDSARAVSVLERGYAWVRPLARLDCDCLEACAALIEGAEHDFSAFCRTGSDTPHHRCRISWACWERGGGELVFTVQADRFLRGMVRMLVGAMLAVASGKAPAEDFSAALRERSHWFRAVPAPACGLTLIRVDYPEQFNFADDQEDFCAVR